METLILLNETAGCGDKIDRQKLQARFGGDVVAVGGKNPDVEKKGYTRVVACGGDGTLNRLLNDFYGLSLVYVPCGTFNETSKNAEGRGENKLEYAGVANGKYFSYVLAAGAFTPLGYVVDIKKKKRLKIAAYFLRVLPEYKVYRIKASVAADGKEDNGEYSLIMLSRSERCFGFKFNKMYGCGNNRLQLLTIKSPKHDGILGRIEMFFPFFRAFFIGFNKEYHSKNITFVSCDEARVVLDSATPFCADGDRWDMPETIEVTVQKLTPPVTVINPRDL